MLKNKVTAVTRAALGAHLMARSCETARLLNPPMSARHSLQTLLFAPGLAAVLLVGACSKLPEPTGPVTLLAPPPITASQPDDAVVTSSVKKALLADPVMGGFELHVDTRKGTVQLSGMVNNQAQIARALAIAHGVTGVKTVENSLAINSSPHLSSAVSVPVFILGTCGACVRHRTDGTGETAFHAVLPVIAVRRKPDIASASTVRLPPEVRRGNDRLAGRRQPPHLNPEKATP